LLESSTIFDEANENPVLEGGIKLTCLPNTFSLSKENTGFDGTTMAEVTGSEVLVWISLVLAGDLETGMELLWHSATLHVPIELVGIRSAPQTTHLFKDSSLRI